MGGQTKAPCGRVMLLSGIDLNQTAMSDLAAEAD